MAHASRIHEFIQSTKNKIRNKDPIVPEVFSLCDDVLLYNDRVVIPKKPTKKNPQGFSYGTSGEEPYEKPHALLCILAKHGQGYNRHDRILQGMRACSKTSNYNVQTMAKNRPSMAENPCGFFRVHRQHVMFWPVDPAKNAIQGNALEGSDTFWWHLWEEIAWAEIGWWNGTR